MRKDNARITFLVEPELKRQFEELCASRDITLSQVLRQFMKQELATAKAGRNPAVGRKSKH
jgi:antitoxin component of RelBE/YafQ-DinJ toxin-antitoxin module